MAFCVRTTQAATIFVFIGFAHPTSDLGKKMSYSHIIKAGISFYSEVGVTFFINVCLETFEAYMLYVFL